MDEESVALWIMTSGSKKAALDYWEMDSERL